MNAAPKQDFAEFLAYIEGYSIGSIGKDPTKVASIKLAHAQYLALLTLAAECISDSGSVKDDFNASYDYSGASYLGEVVSDCSEFFMCLLQGLYRSSGGTLRSAIESYLKAFSSSEQPSILQRTSVPEVFNDAMQASFFTAPAGKVALAGLKGIYTELNAYVHTVSEAQMFRALAVGSFPRWSTKTEDLIDIFVRAMRLFLYGVVGSRRDLFDRFDHRNKVIINRALTRQQRRSALGVDD